MVNIKEIAKQAGVSVTTVSRVLNHHPYVSEDKRLRVQQVIEQNSYTPNSQAISLIRGKTRTVGLILPFSHHPYYHAIIAGVMEEAYQYGYHVLLCQTSYNPDQEREYLHMLSTRQVDGVISCSRVLPWAEFQSYSESGPIVVCEYTEESNLSAVYTDHYDSFCRGIQYLLDRGYTRIGYCIGRKTSASSQERFRAYQNTLHAAGLEVYSDWIFPDCIHMSDGEQIAKHIAAMDKPPSALIVTGDEAAAGVMLGARQYGLRIPDQLAIIGYDNQPISAGLQLTTIDQNLQEIGRQAFSLFYERSLDPALTPVKRLIPYTLIERSSV